MLTGSALEHSITTISIWGAKMMSHLRDAFHGTCGAINPLSVTLCLLRTSHSTGLQSRKRVLFMQRSNRLREFALLLSAFGLYHCGQGSEATTPHAWKSNQDAFLIRCEVA